MADGNVFQANHKNAIQNRVPNMLLLFLLLLLNRGGVMVGFIRVIGTSLSIAVGTAGLVTITASLSNTFTPLTLMASVTIASLLTSFVLT